MAVKDFLVTVRRPKFWITSSVVGLALLLVAWGLTQSALEAGRAETPPSPLLLWHMGPEGVFVAWAYGILSFFLPLLPILVVYDAFREDRLSGFLETALARPLPRWGLGLGKATGMAAALVIPVVTICTIGSVLVQVLLEAPLPASLVLSVLGATVLLAVLYVALGLLLAVLLPAGAALFALFIIWIGFAAVSPSGFFLGGQFLLIVPIQGAQSHQVAWGDLASFNGYYTGLLALFVPADLNFVVWPSIENWPLLLAAWGVTYLGFIWIPILLALYLAGYQRLELKRSS